MENNLAFVLNLILNLFRRFCQDARKHAGPVYLSLIYDPLRS